MAGGAECAGGCLLPIGGFALALLGVYWTLAFWLVTLGAAGLGDSVTYRWRERPPGIRR